MCLTRCAFALVTDTEAKGIVRLVVADSGFEALRKLYRKYLPKSLAQKGMKLRGITNFGE